MLSDILSMLSSLIIYTDIFFIIYHFFYMLSFYHRQFFFKKWAQILLFESAAYLINPYILFTGLTVQLVLSSLVLILSNKKSSSHYNVLICLGYKIFNNQLNDTLRYRLNLLINIAKLYPASRIILCGGLSESNTITEAELMKEYLIEKGIKKERIILEDKSATTAENIDNARIFINPGESILLISSSYHCLRARLLCKKKGIDVDTAGSGFPLKLLSNELLLEKYCLFKDVFKLF